jgi:hypothetical protein
MPRTRTFGLDKDTIAYAARVKAGSGKTILPDSLKQINKFVVGLKRLNLWNSTICWPMRNMHNAGTGSTVYSLGGMGTYNGILTNNTNWSSDGLNMYFSTADTISVSNFVINDLVNGLNFLAYFTPRGSNPASSTASNHFTIYYPSGTVWYQFGTSGSGGTSNIFGNFYSMDGNRYYTAGINIANVLNKSVVYTSSNKNQYFYSPDVSVGPQSFVGGLISRASPNTLTIKPVASTGEVGCTLEFFIVINNFDTTVNRQLIQNLYTRSFKTSKIYY